MLLNYYMQMIVILMVNACMQNEGHDYVLVLTTMTMLMKYVCVCVCLYIYIYIVIPQILTRVLRLTIILCAF